MHGLKGSVETKVRNWITKSSNDHLIHLWSRVAGRYNSARTEALLRKADEGQRFTCALISRASAIRKRNRLESRLVPEPITRLGGSPEIFQAQWVRMSTGFDTRSRIVSGLQARARKSVRQS